MTTVITAGMHEDQQRPDRDHGAEHTLAQHQRREEAEHHRDELAAQRIPRLAVERRPLARVLLRSLGEGLELDLQDQGAERDEHAEDLAEDDVVGEQRADGDEEEPRLEQRLARSSTVSVRVGISSR